MDALNTLPNAEPESGFDRILDTHGLELRRGPMRVLQLNLGKLCNQTCVHCHVGAGPGRKEIMTAETAGRIIEWIAETERFKARYRRDVAEICRYHADSIDITSRSHRDSTEIASRARRSSSRMRSTPTRCTSRRRTSSARGSRS